MRDLQVDKCLQNVRSCILAEIEKRRWDITEAAIQCDMSYRNLQSILYDEHKDIKLSTLIKISNALDISLVDMIGDNEERKDVYFLESVYATLKNYMTMRGGVAA